MHSWQKSTQGLRSSSGGPSLQQAASEVAASTNAPSSRAERDGSSSGNNQQSGAEQGPETNGGSLSAYAQEDRSSEEETDFLRPSISGRSSGDSSLGRIFTAQSSLDPVPETSEAAPVDLDKMLGPLTSYPVRLSPAASSTGGGGYGGISPRSSLLSQPSGGEQGPPGGGGENPPPVYGSPGRSPMIRRQSSLKPPRPPGSALKSPAKSLTFSTAPPETCCGPTSLSDDSTPRAPTSVFSTTANQPSSSVSAPRNSFEERLLSGGFASASSPGQSTFRASPSPSQFGFDQRMPSFATLPIEPTISPFDRGGTPSQLQQSLSKSLSLGDESNGGPGLSLYTAAIPTLDVPPPSESLLVMAVSEEGYVWQWDLPVQELFEDDKAAPAFPSAPTMLPTAFSIAVPSKTANAAAPAATGSTKPRLLGLLQTLPHSVTTFSVCCPEHHALSSLRSEGRSTREHTMH